MSILNLTSDGIYPELIVLFKSVAMSEGIDSESLVNSCAVHDSDAGDRSRLWTVIRRWTDLGLFVDSNDSIELAHNYKRVGRQTIDAALHLLPKYCCELLFQKENCEPLWGDKIGTSADVTRALAWLLTQDIYKLPTTGWPKVEPIVISQTTGDKKLIQNDTRWNGLRSWARFLGFSVGEGRNFFADPTMVIRSQLPDIFGKERELSAKDFLNSLGSRLPVLDYGNYREQVEETLDSRRWRSLPDNHLSMSLSFALKRLEASGLVRLKGKADAGSSYRLTKNNYDSWGGFEVIDWSGKAL